MSALLVCLPSPYAFLIGFTKMFWHGQELTDQAIIVFWGVGFSSKGNCLKVHSHYAVQHTAAQRGKATQQKLHHAASVCGHCIDSAASCHLILRGLKIRSVNCRFHQRKPRDVDAATLFSVVLKTADRVALMLALANDIPTKGKRVAYMIRHKYGLMRAAAAGNNFISTSVL